MAIVEPPTRWIFDVATRGKTRSRLTWASYAEGMLDWLRTCEANGWDYLRPSEGELGAYRDHMLLKTAAGESPYSDSFINGRLRRIDLFYRWAVANSIVPDYPFFREEHTIRDADRGPLAHISRRQSALKLRLTLRVRKKIPQSIPTRVISEIRQTLSQRDRLIVDWALTTGARLNEIRSLNLDQLPNSQRTISKVLDVKIIVTKGSTPRTLKVPASLIDRTHHYIYGDRAKIVKNRRGLKREVPDRHALWLSERGLRVSAKTIQKNFRSAVAMTGSSATFHDLRHTFAIAIYRALRRAHKEDGHMDPLKTLMYLLGHSNISSTQVYLEASAIDVDSIEGPLQDLLGSV